MLPRHLLLTALIAFPLTGDAAPVQDAAGSFCADLPGRIDGRRVVCADIAALDAMLTYNRFGSYNPFGMIFALRRDLVPADLAPQAITAAQCAADDGTDKTLGPLTPGNVRLRDCKRPRPLGREMGRPRPLRRQRGRDGHPQPPGRHAAREPRVGR